MPYASHCLPVDDARLDCSWPLSMAAHCWAGTPVPPATNPNISAQMTGVPPATQVVALHGMRSQKERDDAMLAFRSGKVQVMVATDVAARGLHIRCAATRSRWPGADVCLDKATQARAGRMALFHSAFA